MKLSVLETGHKDIAAMRSLLKLVVNGSEGPTWALTDQPGGDLTIIDVDSPVGEEVWQRLVRCGERPVALTGSREFEAHHVLYKPVRIRDFLDLVTSSWQQLSINGTGQEALAEENGGELPAGLGELPRWRCWKEPENSRHATLAEHLRRQTWKSAILIDHPGWPSVIIDPGSGSWFFDGSISELSPEMFSLPLPPESGQAISSVELSEWTAGMRRRALGELKWYAGLTQSRGLLHPHLVDDVEFMLTHLPPQANDNERYARLARLLQRSPITLGKLARTSGEEVETIACFLNACYTTGNLLINHSVRAVAI